MDIHPSILRNRDPILRVLAEVLPLTGTVLEVACGTGAHSVYFSQRMPRLTWQPTDKDPEHVRLTGLRREQEGPDNLLAPLQLDVTEYDWPVESADAMVNINMIHISPWEAAVGLLRGASHTLKPGGILYIYGPFTVLLKHTAPSNRAFDEMLRSRDPRWGVRDLDEIVEVADENLLALQDAVDMPANNFSLIFRRR